MNITFPYSENGSVMREIGGAYIRCGESPVGYFDPHAQAFIIPLRVTMDTSSDNSVFSVPGRAHRQ